MSPSLAAVACAAGVAWLLWIDRDPKSRTSLSLWIPVAWMFLGASRMVTQWLNAGVAIDSADQYLEGSPLDAAILSGLLLAGLIVLAARKEKTLKLLRANIPLVVFLAFCAASTLWSDFPFVSIKRFMKTLGNVTMVLIVLSDQQPMAALRKVFTRTALFLIPVSVLLIKYYPEIGRSYDRWTGLASYNGIAIGKNSLGNICIVFGLTAAWALLDAVRTRTLRWRLAVTQGVILLLAVWLLTISDSATAAACFVVGAVLLTLLMRADEGRRGAVHVLAGAAVFVAITAFGLFNADAYLLDALGRDATLTGRTELWGDLLRADLNPWIGAGFESFWLGPRVDLLWSKYWWHPNQAHNGYLETYLNLGWTGVGLLAVLVISGYRRIVAAYRVSARTGAIRFVFFVTALLYNTTEAGFKVMHPVFIAFLFAVIATPADLPGPGEQPDFSSTSGPKGVPERVNPRIRMPVRGVTTSISSARIPKHKHLG